MSSSERVPSAPGSREPEPSCTGSGPSGFDPSRVIVLCNEIQSRLDSAKSFHTCDDAETLEIYHDCLVDAVRLFVGGLHAIAMEARRGETAQTGSTAEGGDSAGRRHRPTTVAQPDNKHG